MFKKVLPCATLLIALLAFPLQNAHAQMDIEVGPTVGFDLNAFNALSVGADARFDLEEIPVRLNPTFDYYVLGGDSYGGASVTAFAIGANALYDLDLDGDLTPYVGAGLNYTQVSVSGEGMGGFGFSGSTTGLNLIGGASFDLGGFQPFVQGKFSVAGVGSLAIGGGLLFDI